MSRQVGIFSSKDEGFSWWWFGLKIGVISTLIIWWWLENKNKKSVRETSRKAMGEDITSIPLPDEAVSQETGVDPAADDLTKIEGIGPKICAALLGAGIRTFGQLAASKPAALKQILTEAGIRIGYPDTWPEQAALAAKADWIGLEELQSGLQGGRRVDPI